MYKQLIDRDKLVNWHPYSQMKTSQIIPILKGEGVYLYAADGRQYVDMVSSWWVSIHGHSNSFIAERVYRQLLKLEQVIFAGFTHEPAIQLAERLLSLLPISQKKVFYSDNGSTAVEVALKMCLQYHFNQGKRKNKLLAFKQGYHGDTFGAMSVSERGVWTAPFADQLFEVIFIDPPNADNLEHIKHEIAQHAPEIACFIYEPLIQGAGGMLMHRAQDLDQLLTYCKSQEIFLIQDEVFVGFGRTGLLFAADHLTVDPDVMCFSKGLTGGTMAMGITSCSDKIYQAFYQDDKKKALFHGHSFTASPIGCAAALASLDLLLSENTQKQIQMLVEAHQAFVKKAMDIRKVEGLRCFGTVLAFEFTEQESPTYFHEIQEKLYQYFLDRGVLLRPLGNTLYLVPPYCISQETLEQVYELLLALIENGLPAIS